MSDKWNFIGNPALLSPAVTTIAGFNRPASAVWSPLDQRIYVLSSRGFLDWDLTKINPLDDTLSAPIPIAANTYNDPGFANYYGELILGSNNKLYLPEHGSGSFAGMEIKVFDILSQTFDAPITSAPYDLGGGVATACLIAGNDFFVALLAPAGRVAKFNPAFVDLAAVANYTTGVTGISRFSPIVAYHPGENVVYNIGVSSAVFGSPISNPNTWAAVPGWSDASTYGLMGACYLTATQELLVFTSQKAYTFKNGTFTERYSFSTVGIIDVGSNPILAANGKVYVSTIDTGASSRIYSYNPSGHTIDGQSSTSVNINCDGRGCYVPLTNHVYIPNWSATNGNVVRKIPCVF